MISQSLCDWLFSINIKISQQKRQVVGLSTKRIITKDFVIPLSQRRPRSIESVFSVSKLKKKLFTLYKDMPNRGKKASEPGTSGIHLKGWRGRIHLRNGKVSRTTVEARKCDRENGWRRRSKKKKKKRIIKRTRTVGKTIPRLTVSRRIMVGLTDDMKVETFDILFGPGITFNIRSHLYKKNFTHRYLSSTLACPFFPAPLPLPLLDSLPSSAIFLPQRGET